MDDTNFDPETHEIGIGPKQGMGRLGVRREAFDATPWIAKSLLKAFEEAKAWALHEMRFSGAHRFMLPWLFADLDEIDELFGDDLWLYGIEPNRPTLGA